MSDFEQLGARERQIVEAVYKLEHASVAEVLKNLSDPPSYSAVRAMLNVLVEKGYLDWRQEGNRYIYLPTMARDKAQKSVARKMLDTFFAGRATDAIAALLDVASDRLDGNDYRQLKEMIETSRKQSPEQTKE